MPNWKLNECVDFCVNKSDCVCVCVCVPCITYNVDVDGQLDKMFQMKMVLNCENVMHPVYY